MMEWGRISGLKVDGEGEVRGCMYPIIPYMFYYGIKMLFKLCNF